MKWFNNPETLEDLKKQYKRLAFQNHPDRGGKTSDMQEINAEYEDLFSRLKDVHKNAQGEFYTVRTATTETATEFMDIIEKLIRMDGIEIEVCGSWLWVTGDTRPHKEDLKALKFRWSSNKGAWYFHRCEAGGFDYWGELCSDEKDYEAARERLQAKSTSEIKPCYEDVLAEILEAGGKLIVFDYEEDEYHDLTMEKILRGWKKYIEQQNTFDFDEYDAVSADCILQYAIFGDVIYG